MSCGHTAWTEQSHRLCAPPTGPGVFSLAEHSAGHREGNFFMQCHDASQEGAPLRDKAGGQVWQLPLSYGSRKHFGQNS